MRKCGPILATAALGLFLFSLPTRAQDAAALQSYFMGKQVVVKIDMPGSQKGVDLRFNKPTPMDWKEYGSRCKQFGVAIRQGDVARITTIVVKKDMMEFQLDGGGFGTAGDDTKTTVDAKVAEKSDYEKDLENQIANTDDPDKKADLQRQLDRERARRQRQDAINQQQAAYASQQKAQVVAQNRANGGSRFNLRWSGSVPANLSPEKVMQLLAPYVNFNAVAPTASGVVTPGDAPPQPSAQPAQGAGDDANVPATAKLHRGMKIEEVTSLFGSGKQLSESTDNNGLKTSIYSYSTSDRHIEVTYVEGLVVRYTISSN
jgi:hypothetical protein